MTIVGSTEPHWHASPDPVRTRIGITLICGLLTATGVSPVWASDSWSVTKPYANNPLREASIAGTVRVGETTVPSTLTVGCRADGEGAVMTASFVSPDTLDFPFGDFEGPGGVGGNEALLSVAVDDEAASAHNVSGWHIDEVQFVFSFLAPQEEASRWQERSGKDLAIGIHLTTPDALAPSDLRADFRLPDDAEGLSDVIGPCLSATVINQ